jgi:hypothetical protein
MVAPAGRQLWMNFQFFQHVEKSHGEAIAYLELSAQTKNTV